MTESIRDPKFHPSVIKKFIDQSHDVNSRIYKFFNAVKPQGNLSQVAVKHIRYLPGSGKIETRILADDIHNYFHCTLTMDLTTFCDGVNTDQLQKDVVLDVNIVIKKEKNPFEGCFVLYVDDDGKPLDLSQHNGPIQEPHWDKDFVDKFNKT